jgi:hypothetical protein
MGALARQIVPAPSRTVVLLAPCPVGGQFVSYFHNVTHYQECLEKAPVFSMAKNSPAKTSKQ